MSHTFRECLYVKLDWFHDDLLGMFAVFKRFYFYLLVLQLLVIFEESVNLLKHMIRKFTDVIIMRNWHVVQSDCDNLVIFFFLVDHSHHSDDFSLNQGKRLHFDTANDQNIQRIFVIAISLGYESIVCWVMNWTKKNSIKFEQTTFLIEFILNIGTDRNLDDSINDSWGFFTVRDIMPRIFNEMLLHFLKVTMKNYNELCIEI